MLGYNLRFSTESVVRSVEHSRSVIAAALRSFKLCRCCILCREGGSLWEKIPFGYLNDHRSSEVHILEDALSIELKRTSSDGGPGIIIS